jgi:outer membrane protein assembly factor BamB
VVWGGKVFLTTALTRGATESQTRPNPGEWSPGDGLARLSLLIGNVRPPPNVEYQWQVLCLDLASGQIAWQQTAKTGRPTIPIHANNTYATETPVTDGERVVAWFGAAGVFFYDQAGKLQLSKEVGGYPTQMDWGTASSPVMHGDKIYLQCDNDKQSFLVALDNKTGDEVWRAERDERSNWSTPLIWQNDVRTELIAGGGGKMRSYDPATGELLWEMAGSGRSAASPVATRTLLFVNSADRLTGQRGIVAAIRPGAIGDISLTGETAKSDAAKSDATRSDTAKSDFVVWSANLPGHRVASPLVIGDFLYLLEQQAAIVRCLDAHTGKEHYRKRLPGATGLTASPWTSGGKVFCLDQSGQTFVIEPATELKIIATNKLGDEMFWASPAISGERLLLRGVEHLYCVQ